MLFRSAKTHAARVTTLLAITAALGGATGCTFAMEMGPQQPEPAAAAGGRTAAQSEPTSAAGEPTPAESTPAVQAPAPSADEELELNGVAVSVGSLTGSLRLAD